jgi:hypothetical protein
MKHNKNNWLDKYIPEAQNGIEGTMGGLTDIGFNYNGAWGGPSMKMGGTLPGSVGFTYARTQSPAPSNGKYAKKTKASAQNGREMQFYQNGLDWKPKTISEDGSVIEEDPELLNRLLRNSKPEFTGRGVVKSREVDQAERYNKQVALTKKQAEEFKQRKLQAAAERKQRIAVSDKMKEASYFSKQRWQPENIAQEAGAIGDRLSLQNLPFVGKYIPDFLDATGAVGSMASGLGRIPLNVQQGNYGQAAMAVATPLAVGALAGLGTQNTGQFVNNLVNPLAGAENLIPKGFKSEINWGNWNKDIPGNTQLMNEYNAIEQTTKANNTWMKNPDGSKFVGTPQEFIVEHSAQFKKSFPHGYEVVYKGVGANGRMDNITPTDVNEYMMPFFAGDENIANKFTSQYHNKNSPYISHNNVKFNSKANAEVHKFYLPKDENPIVIDLGKQNWGNFKLPENAISGDDRYQIMRGVLGNNSNTAALQRYIKDNNINYIKLENVIEKGNSTLGTDYIINPQNNFFPKSAIGNDGMFDMTNPNIYKAAVPVIGAGVLASQDKKKNGGWLNKFEEGGIIEDDMGQWSHPGEITKINSNQITMEGVYQDIVGISDAGDVKYMKPGGNYKFKGSEVTEIPVNKINNWLEKYEK